LLFAQNFFKHPMMLGSIIPSSRFLIDSLLAEVDFSQARTFVEYGPGVGSFTAELLRRMHPDARLTAFELNTDFVEHLRARLPDPRLRVVAGSAANVQAELGAGARADVVISGIPFSTMPPEVRDAVLDATRDCLSPSGALLVYQFSRAVRPHLERRFAQVHERFIPLNILPARFWACRR
jgi:phospholipid N-methyltransferase